MEKNPAENILFFTIFKFPTKMWKNMQSDSAMTFLFGKKDLWTKFMMDKQQNDKVERKKINNSSLLLPPSGKYMLNKYLQWH